MGSDGSRGFCCKWCVLYCMQSHWTCTARLPGPTRDGMRSGSTAVSPKPAACDATPSCSPKRTRVPFLRAHHRLSRTPRLPHPRGLHPRNPTKSTSPEPRAADPVAYRAHRRWTHHSTRARAWKSHGHRRLGHLVCAVHQADAGHAGRYTGRRQLDRETWCVQRYRPWRRQHTRP